MTGSHRMLERTVVAALAVLWLVCLLASSGTVLGGRRYPLVFVSDPPTAAEWPIVTAFRVETRGDPETTPAIGDVVLRVGDADVRGIGPLRFLSVFVEQAGHADHVTAEVRRGGVTRTVLLPAGSARLFLPLLLASPVFAGVALLLWLRARADASARAFAASFADLAFFLAGNILGTPAAVYAAFAIHTLTMTLTGPLGLWALLGFPDGRRLDRRARWPWLFAVLGPLHTAQFGWPVPPAIGIPAAALVVVALLAVEVGIVTRAYRRSDPIGRRQVRWLLFGMYCAALPPIVTGALVAIHPAFHALYSLSLASIACIPIALLISILRFNLFDVDRLISATASYNVLLTAAITIGAAIVPPTAQASAQLFGVDPWIGQLGLSLPLAACVVAVHHRLRPRIERIFFAERHAIDVGMHALLGELSTAGTPQELLRRMGDGLTRLLRPETCVVYARRDDGFVACVAEGRAVPTTIARDGPLLSTLEAHRRPIVLDPTGSRRPVALDPFERAVLETLGAAVVLPIWRHASLLLILCLGRKRSGDVYTPTDVRLLAMLADKVCAELERFEQEETLAQSRSMQEALRRYVPGAVADALGTGADLEPSEREITVLFVDLRGYTTLCEPLAPHEIFATVNRYTETASAAIRRRGGTVVEFNGDGMMAMFGAPAPLADKEAAAVQAARELVAALAASPPAGGDRTPLAVGIGIATGMAFVGNIRSADRVIWTAVGNTVNLAARLQQLTRELDAVIATDAPTHAAAGAAADGFRSCPDVVVRGRRATIDVYVLPHAGQAAAA